MKKLLTEGGLAGHINHLHEDREMTFGKLKEIISKLCSGEITATEKMDGYNLFATIRNGECYVARNKTEAFEGGVNAKVIPSRVFKGGEGPQQAFWDAAQVFENAFYDVSTEDIRDIFGENGNIFYNLEVINKNTQNVINYAKNLLILLPVGHISVDFSSKSMDETVDIKQFYKKFAAILPSLDERASTLEYKFIKSPEVRNQAPDLRDNITKSINKIQKDHGLSDFSKIKDFVFKNIVNNLSKMKNFDIQQDEIKEVVAKLLLGMINTSQIPQDLDETDRNFVAAFSKTSKNGKKMLDVSIWPLEKALHDFSVAYLKEIETYESKLSNSSVKDTLRQAIEAMKAYDGEGKDEVKSILDRNLSKISNIDDVNEYIEGLVFDFEGETYKLTGNFAPVNQIIGVYKYGRGKIPPLNHGNIPNDKDTGEKTGKIKENDTQSGPAGISNSTNSNFINNTADSAKVVSSEAFTAIFPGSFKPPHAGHYSVVQKLLEYKNAQGELLVNDIVILISPKARYSGDYKIFVDAEKSQEIWQFFIKDERVKVQLCDKSPVQATFDYIKGNTYGVENFIVVTSEKDSRDGRFKQLKSYAPDVNIKLAIMPNYNNIDSTRLRTVISQNDYNTFIEYMPLHLDKNVIRNIWSTLKNQTHNSLYDTFVKDTSSNDRYSELVKRYPTLSKDKQFVSDLVLKEEIKKTMDRISGGLADREAPGDFDMEELRKGISVEMEHTDDKDIALEIAMDHLVEDPKYYSNLKKIHKED